MKRWKRISIAVERVVDGVAGGLRAGADGLASGLGTLGEGVAGIGGAGADIAVAERLAGSVEIRRRLSAMAVTGGKAECETKRNSQNAFAFHDALNL